MTGSVLEQYSQGPVATKLREGATSEVSGEHDRDRRLASANTGPPVCPPHTQTRACVPNTGPPAC